MLSRGKNLPRPNVDRDAPDIRVNVWLHKETASIALDLSGDGLHLRGYRDRAGIAPIKETHGSRYCDAIRLAAREHRCSIRCVVPVRC